MTGAGARRDRVVIETDVGTSRDAGGQRVEDWQPFARRWAGKVPQSSREFYRLSHQRSDLSYVLLLRKDSKLDGLTKKMRVRKGNQILNIVGIDPDVRGERREIALQCIEAT